MLATLLALSLAPWTFSVSEGATPSIAYAGTQIVSAQPLFWGPSWSWVSTELKREADWRVSGGVADLGLSFSGNQSVQGSVIRTDLTINAARELSGITGGGFEFLLTTDSPAARGMGEPELLPENRGWRWAGEKGTMSLQIEPAAASVYFEPGDRRRIRVMLLAGDVKAGPHRFRLTLTAPQGATPVARRENAGEPEWMPSTPMHPNQAPIDLSGLNDEVAGQRGFLLADGEDLRFEDGTKARFWGGNLAAYTLFAEKEQIERHAKRIAALGYNLMRIHHHDSTAWVSPTVIDKNRDDSQAFDLGGLDKIDYWIKCLRDEGVYVWLDLHVGRQLKPGDGVREGFDEIARQNGEVKGFNFFNPDVARLMREFDERYLTHVNPYTGLAYKDEPAIVGLLITNENDLVHHFGNLMLGDKGNPVHNAIFVRQSEEFARKHGLDVGATQQTWLPGPSKLFLADREHAFFSESLRALRALGVKVPISTTNYWGGSLLSTLPVLPLGGIVDIHSYGGDGELSRNPRNEANAIAWIAAGQVAGYPTAITEWNVHYPAGDRYVGPIYTAAMAALQGWDMPMIYNYSQNGIPVELGGIDQWSTYKDPAIQALMPAAALLYRRGDVSLAQRHFVLSPSREQLFFEALDPSKSASIRTLAEQSRLSVALPRVPELPWMPESPIPEGATIVREMDRDFLPEGTVIESDTGELRRDFEAGWFTVDTRRTQAALGWVGGKAVALSDVSFNLATAQAGIAVSSLSDDPIASASEILVSFAARAVPTDGRMPFRSERVSGTVTLRTTRTGWSAWALGPDGSRKALAVQESADGLAFELPADSHWVLLESR